MNKAPCFHVLLILIALAIPSAAQRSEGQAEKKPQPLKFTQAIPLPSVQGRFDHFSADLDGGRIFLSALGNDTEEVIDTIRGSHYTITGLGMPQGVVYSPEFHKLFIGNRVAGPRQPDEPGKGLVKVIDASSPDFKVIDTIEFHADCDNLRYDPADKRVYVGFGDGPKAGIAMIDAATDKRVGDFILGAHPESFQLEKSGHRIFANIADDNQIDVIDRKTGAVTKWPLMKGLASNFPMALDEEHQRLLIGVRTPPRLAVLEMNSGKVIATLPAAASMDDLYYDAVRKRIYVTGDGLISVFQQDDADHYHLLATVPSAPGARTAGFFSHLGKKSKGDTFVVAAPARGGREAEVRFYSVED